MSAPRISLYRELSLYSGWSRRTGVLQTLAGIFGGKLSTKHSLAIFTCEARKHGNRWISLRSIYQQHRIPRSLHCANGDTKMENMRRKESRQKREKKLARYEDLNYEVLFWGSCFVLSQKLLLVFRRTQLRGKSSIHNRSLATCLGVWLKTDPTTTRRSK